MRDFWLVPIMMFAGVLVMFINHNADLTMTKLYWQHEPSMSSASITTTTWLPSWLTAEEQLEDLEAWLSNLLDELQAPPSPKPVKMVSKIEAAYGMQSKAIGYSKNEVVSGRYLRYRLRSLDATVNCLQKIRRDLQGSVTEAHAGSPQ